MSRASSSNGSIEQPPALPPDSPGSSVSSRLQEEYDELLKYAVVVPDYNPKDVRGKLSDGRGVFDKHEDIITIRASPRSGLLRDLEAAARREEEDAEEGEKTPRRREEHSGEAVKQLPDFGESPIGSHGGASFTHQPREPSNGMRNGPSFPQPFFPEGARMRRGEERDGVSSANTTSTGPPIDMVYTATVDQDVGKMEMLLDQWCLELKRNVLAEFSQAKIVIEQKSRQDLLRETNRHCGEKEELIREMDNMKEMLHTYEQSLERKDAVIANLTQAVHRQRDKLQLMKNFCQWRVHHNDVKREAFTMQMARHHHERSLNRRVLSAWFSLIHNKWRQRVEKACQNKAQEICMQVTADYEAKIASLNEAQESSRDEVRRLHHQRETYEEAMKKAFMRGVCALNMEAMSIFHGDEAPNQSAPVSPRRAEEEEVYSDNLDSIVPDKNATSTKSIPQSAVRSSASNDAPGHKIVTSQGSRPASASSAPRQTSAKPSSSLTTASQKSRLVTKVTGKGGDSGRTATRSLSPSVYPPVASVIVERHQPVTKQTIGQATAARFAKSATDPDKFRKIAGQGVGKTPAIHTVRVVD